MREIKKILSYYDKGGEFTAFDTETTGLYSRCERIVEIGAYRFNKDGVIGVYNVLVNPEKPMPKEAFMVNGISDNMLVNQPTFDIIAGNFMDFIADSILIAHNANFDISFLNMELARINKPLLCTPCVPAADTLKITRKLYPNLGKYNLQFLANHFSLDKGNAHRASDDARVCMEIFKNCMSFLSCKLQKN
jgi:DNA polymerase-3 subunit epsilon